MAGVLYIHAAWLCRNFAGDIAYSGQPAEYAQAERFFDEVARVTATRNPNDAPDSDFRGWKFRLDKLNQFNGNFVAAEMVKAFLTPTEYRRRFGSP